jgi:polyisoprenyl-phosphate glycosyltransferase
MNPNPRVSVAIPVHNEESVVPELLRRVTDVLDTLPGGSHEMVFVDDGSSDRTLALLEQAAAQDARVAVISLSRNFGHQAAITAALDHTTGDVTIVMDGDLQDAPEAIPQFLAKYGEGYDVVYARRVNRKENWWLRASYWAYYRMLARMSHIYLPLDSGDFGLMSARVVNELRRMPERQRYVRGLRTWVGFRQTGIEVERAERHSGESKYSAWGLLKLASDGIFAFSTVPIRAALMLGVFAMGVSTLFALYALVAKLFLNRSPQGFTALIVVITFLSGVNLAFLGIIGEYVGRIYEEIKARPIYVIGKMIRNGRPVSVASGQQG